MNQQTVALTVLTILALLVPVTALTQQHSVQLTWQDTVNPSGSVTYSAYRGSGACSANPTMTLIKNGITTLAYTDTALAAGKYCYCATAVDIPTGVESAPSNSADVKVLPHSPTALTGTEQ